MSLYSGTGYNFKVSAVTGGGEGESVPKSVDVPVSGWILNPKYHKKCLCLQNLSIEGDISFFGWYWFTL